MCNYSLDTTVYIDSISDDDAKAVWFSCESANVQFISCPDVWCICFQESELGSEWTCRDQATPVHRLMSMIFRICIT